MAKETPIYRSSSLQILFPFVLGILVVNLNNATAEVQESQGGLSTEISPEYCQPQPRLHLTDERPTLDFCTKDNTSLSKNDISTSPTSSLNLIVSSPVTKKKIIAFAVPVILFCAIVLLSYGFLRWSRVARMINAFPGPTLYPIIGSCQDALFNSNSPEDLVPIFSSLTKKHGRIMRIWRFHQPMLVVSDPDVAQKFLSSTTLIEKGKIYESFKWLLGDGLITSNAKVWKNDRKMLSPSFKYQKFDGFLASFNHHSKILVSLLHTKFISEDRKTLNLHSTFCRCTMDLITESALGKKTSFQIDTDNELCKATNLSLDVFRQAVIRPWRALPIIRTISGLASDQERSSQTLFSIMGSIIQERKNKLLEDHKDGIDPDETKPFIDVLLRNQKSNREIYGHVATIFGAGFETTASTLNYSLYLLALNPTCQAKVHQELDGIFQDMDQDATFSHLTELKYLEMCIKESLRIFPPAPIIVRSTQEDVPLGNGLVIPRGVDVYHLIYEMHRNPRYFPNPEKFEPERFLPYVSGEIHPYSYLPFSLGPRGCLGQKYAMIQVKTILSHILRHFSVTTTQKRENLKLMYGMVLEPLGGIHLTLTPRHSRHSHIM